MITYFGIKSCDTIKRAGKALTAAGLTAHFHDFRVDGADKTLMQGFVDALGADVLINTRGTTWRGLSDAEKAKAESDPAGLLADYPALVKRPVWRKADGALRVGFAKKEEADVLTWLRGG